MSCLVVSSPPSRPCGPSMFDISGMQFSFIKRLLIYHVNYEEFPPRAITKSNLMNVDPTLSREHQRPDLATTLHMAEGFALVILCHCRLTTRRIAHMILKEVSLSFFLSWHVRFCWILIYLLIPSGEESVQRARILTRGMYCP